MHKEKIIAQLIIIGPYPPVIGGVSTHIHRVSQLLENNNLNVKVVSTNPIPKEDNRIYIPLFLLPFYLITRKQSLMHFHVSSIPFLFTSWFVRLRQKTLLTIHNNRYPTNLSKHSLTTKAQWFLLKSFQSIICVNNETKLFLQSRLTNIYNEAIPAFLPPLVLKEESVDFIRKYSKKFDVLLSGYAYRLTMFKGDDLYGVDMMVELMSKLKIKGKNIGLALILNLQKSEYLDEILTIIKRLNLSQNILLIDINQGVDAVALWKLSDIYIRPTNTDGNSISVLEALSVGTTVIASDCVDRPEGTVLFKNRDIDDFVEKVEAVINSENRNELNNCSDITATCKDTYLQLYSKILNSIN